MRLPKYEPPWNSNLRGRHVSAYFKRYLLQPVTELVSQRIYDASKVVLNQVNKRVNVEGIAVIIAVEEFI